MRIISSSKIKQLFVIGSIVATVFVSASSTYASCYNCFAERVAVSGLNVRTGPSTRYRIAGVIHKGETYIKTGETSGAWRQIWYDNNKRWIHGGYANDFDVPCVTVTASALNVRTGPGTRYRKVGVAMRHSDWAVIACDGIWRKIWYASEARWVHGSYLYEESCYGHPEYPGCYGRTPGGYDYNIKELSRPFPEIELSVVNIHNNADRTDSRFVTVHYVSTSSPEYYRISEDPKFSGASWIIANKSKIDYTLSEGAGKKTIYLQLKNEKGRLSNVGSDTINYLPNKVK
jgi:uncharacterized protein YraI